MPKMNVSGRQIKAWLPGPLYKAVVKDAKRSGRPMAEIVRDIISAHYMAPKVNVVENQPCPIDG